jgi:hypothetical protein
VSLHSEFRVVMSVTKSDTSDVRIIFTSSYCRRAYVLFTLVVYVCMFAHSGVQHIFCCVFVVLMIAPSVISNVYLQFLWIVLS